MHEQPCAAIEVEKLSKVYGDETSPVEALRGLDLSVPRGQFVAVMGASGSGKSTLLHLVAGLDRPTAGRIRVHAQSFDELDDDALSILRRRRIGLVFQAFNLLDVLSAEENVALPLVVDGVPRAAALERARAALDSVGLAARGGHFPKQLSGGEQQRVALARALVIEPALVLADEPTGNLDSHSGDRVMALLRELADRHAQTIFMVTHNAAHAELADRIVTLRDGQVVDDRPAHGNRPPQSQSDRKDAAP